MRTVVLIPARYSSTRFPGKPLVKILGKPMILWVAELAEKAVSKENVYVATDNKEISKVALEAGYNVVMTSSTCLTGTDRLAEAVTQIDADIFVNVQGDEPLASPNDILRIASYKKRNIDCVINGFSYIGENENVDNINIPKVVTTEENRLIYMSRKALPAIKDKKNTLNGYKKQVCIYAFTKEQLQQFTNFGRKSVLERFEDIEILRFLELKIDVLMVETESGSLAVDEPEDVAKVENAMIARGYKII